jgi:hypothetical protein
MVNGNEKSYSLVRYQFFMLAHFVIANEVKQSRTICRDCFVAGTPRNDEGCVRTMKKPEGFRTV